MTHQKRRGSPLACPLASLGRNSPSLDTLSYHHHLSTSPLNLKVCQNSKIPPMSNVSSGDIICPPSQNPSDRLADYPHLAEVYQLSRNSSNSLDKPFQLSRNIDQSSKYRLSPPRNYTPIDSILQYRNDPVPSVSYPLSDSMSNDLGNESQIRSNIAAANRSDQYFLEKKMDSLCIQGAIRGLPMCSQTNQYKNKMYYLDDNLKDLCNYNRNARMHNNVTPHLLQRASSPSDTSESDRCLIDQPRSSPSFISKLRNKYSLSNLDRFSPNLDQGYATLVSPSPTNQLPSTPWSKKDPYSGSVFDCVSDEVIMKIFTWLSSSELSNTAAVCRRFETIAWRPTLWKKISLSGEHVNGDKALKNIFRRLCGQSRNGSCSDVERVMLNNGCRITDKGLQLLSRRCPELTHLQIPSSINVSNHVLCDVLTKCTNLQHLDVAECVRITNISVNTNLEPPRRLLLQYLDLTDVSGIDDTGLKIVVRNCPQLVFLYLRRCLQITDTGLKFIPSFCIALKELSVSGCINITDFGLYELAKLGAALRYLSVAKCDRVSDAGLKVVARRCYKLRYLNARGCEAVSDDSITILARSCPRLRALDIGKCDVSDAGLRALAESCPNLKKLSLRNCDMITDRGVQCISYYCRGLQQLNIQDCQISVEGYRAVKKYCKRCVIEHTNPGFF